MVQQTSTRRNRPAFTLVEMLVATALILFIMVILSQAFVAGLGSFRELKAIGDMEEKLRVAVTQIRKDLSADHFEGRRRLSDTNFWSQPVREGFFHLLQRIGSTPEGMDSLGVESVRANSHFLQFAVKLRGNQQERFFTTTLPNATLLAATTNFFSQAPDGRFQDTNGLTYNSPWAEVAYFLKPTGTNAGTGLPLFTLYRSQLVVVPDNRALNWPSNPQVAGFPLPCAPTTIPPYGGYGGFSCELHGPANNQLVYFNNPSDLATPPPANVLADRYRAFNDTDASHDTSRAAVLMTDVLSFDVRVLKYQLNPPALAPIFSDLQTSGSGSFDTAMIPAGGYGYVIKALEITLRVWDPKSEQARQVTIIQDM